MTLRPRIIGFRIEHFKIETVREQRRIVFVRKLNREDGRENIDKIKEAKELSAPMGGRFAKLQYDVYFFLHDLCLFYAYNQT